MSSQKIPNVGRIDVSRISDYHSTKTGVLCRDRTGDLVCHIPCAPKHHDRLIELLYNARLRSAGQIDFGFLDE